MTSHSRCEIRGVKNQSDGTTWIANLGAGIPENFDFVIGKEYSGFEVVSYHTNEKGEEIPVTDISISLPAAEDKNDTDPKTVSPTDI